jgi:hypothetical protein
MMQKLVGLPLVVWVGNVEHACQQVQHVGGGAGRPSSLAQRIICEYGILMLGNEW